MHLPNKGSKPRKEGVNHRRLEICTRGNQTNTSYLKTPSHDSNRIFYAKMMRK